MLPISLAIQTLYAELMQQLRLGGRDAMAGSVTQRMVDGAPHLYATERHGSTRRQRYIGPAGDTHARNEAAAVRQSAARAKERRKLVAMLRSAGISAPAPAVCRVLDALSRENLFAQNRLVLVGTLAYGTYPLLLGQHLTASALATNDIDLGVMPLVVTSLPQTVSLPSILARGEATLEPDRMSVPPSRFRSPTGLVVEFLTVARRGPSSIQPMKSLGISAEALTYMDYLIEDNIEAALAWQDGVLIRVPAPARYSVHKMIVAQLWPVGDPKRSKDLVQAAELMKALETSDPAQLDDAIDNARARGKKWSALVDKGLALIAR